MKFGGGAAGFIIGTVLAAHGYDASHLTSDSIIGIRELFSIIPGVFIILSSALVFFYPLGKQKMEAIAITLKERALKEEQTASIE
jgi:GPH family glycoside/pentoside/hexuronide:cation symporter